MHAWINITHPGFSGRQDMPDDGDQWVSWEQMVATLRAKGEAEGRAALLAREVVELRGEVAKLKQVPAVVVPELTDEDLNRYSMDCDERDAVEFGYNLAASRIIPTGCVAIPPLTGGEIEDRLLKLFPGISEDDPLREWCFKDSRWAYNLAASRARVIPAGRVLVSRDLLRQARDNCQATLAESDISPLVKDYRRKLLGWLDDALRANQGGATT